MVAVLVIVVKQIELPLRHIQNITTSTTTWTAFSIYGVSDDDEGDTEARSNQSSPLSNKGVLDEEVKVEEITDILISK